MKNFYSERYLDSNKIYDFLLIDDIPSNEKFYNEQIEEFFGNFVSADVTDSQLFDLAKLIDTECVDYKFSCVSKDIADSDTRILTIMGLLVDHCCFTKFLSA